MKKEVQNNYKVKYPITEKGNQVLLVEDVVMNQQLAKAILEGKGLEVDLAVNGLEAVDRVKEKQYDLVLMDVHMPVMDGVQATRLIRLLPSEARATTPIVALTANCSDAEVSFYLHYGMNGVIPKPIEDRVLSEVLGVYTRTGDRQERTGNWQERTGSRQEWTGDRGPGTGQNRTVDRGPGTGKGNCTTGQALYDLSMIRTISGGDESFVKKMVQLFLDTMPGNIEILEKAIERKDWEATWRAAHKMKSTIDSMQIVSLKQLVRDIEGKGRKAEGVESIPSQVKELRVVLEQVMEELKQWLQ